LSRSVEVKRIGPHLPEAVARSSSSAAFPIAAAASSSTFPTVGTWASASAHFFSSMYSRTAAMGLAP